MLTEERANNYPKDKLVTLTSKPGKFFAKAESIEDKYDNRHPELLKMVLEKEDKIPNHKEKLGRT